MTYTEEIELHSGETSLTGPAHYEYRVEYAYDADIGGRDGWEVAHCQLQGVMCGEYLCPREELIRMFGAKAIWRADELTMESLQQQLDAGDLMEAAE